MGASPLRDYVGPGRPEIPTPELIAPHPRTRLMREPPGETAWELWLRDPPPGLRDLVAGLWGGDADQSYALHRALPNGELMLMFNLGPPQRLLDGRIAGGRLHRTAWISGLQERPVEWESVIRHPRAIAVQLRPFGAWALFGGLPQHDLADDTTDLESVLGGAAGVEPLRQRMIESPHLGAALDLLEDWLVARLQRGPAAHPVTRAAVARLTTGTARIDSLARDLGVSSRHLGGLFRREVGLSPKGLARILRFERTLARLAAPQSRELAELALECGYYDQSHMDLDFRTLAGMTPTEYRARVLHVPGWRELRGDR
jgi:AraC-like DNA-binding protein